MKQQQNKLFSSWSLFTSVVFIAAFVTYHWLKPTTFELKTFDSLFISLVTLNILFINAKINVLQTN